MRKTKTKTRSSPWNNLGLVLTLGIGSLLPGADSVGDEFVKSNVLQRTYMIRYAQSIGTAFVFDWKSRQYLVTARHVTTGISGTDQIQIYRHKQWKTRAVKVVGIAKGSVDVTVLACDQRLNQPSLRLEPAFPDDMYLSQQVYFVGFPYTWTTGGENINRGYPLPLVKAGIVSAFPTGGRPLVLDAHNNKGFSGGPIVFVPQSSRTGEFHVAAIVSGNRSDVIPIVDKNGKDPMLDDSGQPIGYFKENTGLVAAYPIQHAIDLIDSNPIGFPLRQGG